jgi:hypothetical protein
MYSNPSLVLIVSAVLGIAIAFTLMLVGVLWAQVRSLPVEETTRLVDDLARRQETIEGVLFRLERDRNHQLKTSLTKLPLASSGSAPPPGLGPGQRTDRGKPSAVGGPTLIVVPNLATTIPDASTTAAAELSQRFGAIWALADSGLAAEAIARATGQPIGQVELILGLRLLTSQSAEPS